jgi:hypothetical protein
MLVHMLHILSVQAGGVPIPSDPTSCESEEGRMMTRSFAHGGTEGSRTES